MAERRDGSPPDELSADDELARLRGTWEDRIRRVRRLYTELDRAIREAESAERAYNLALRAAKIQRTDMGGLLLALLGVKYGDPPA